MRTVYKIVSTNNDKLTSMSAYAMCDTTYDDIHVLYEVGKWTKPKIKGSKLFAFDTLENAKEYYRNHCSSYEIIYKAVVLGVSKPKYRALRGMDIISFWKVKHQHGKVVNMSAIVPDGTLWCEKIKLVEEIIS